MVNHVYPTQQRYPVLYCANVDLTGHMVGFGCGGVIPGLDGGGAEQRISSRTS